MTPDLEQLSFHLSEGIADFIARDILDSTTDIPFSRKPQLKMIDRIRNSLSETSFEELLSCALQGAGHVQAMLDKRYGRQLMGLLHNSNDEAIEMIAKYFESN